ncbi:MAG TPA: exopolysaccharide biosynthesis polyprenyl glycosylphosphotransferase [Solirubrobacteraceae bacterium]|jgi:exopolysaccharide biosynthesis polyprenyl glycosylphosphotransferase|nr:exopolysaccharide biosynthesis polyprenyl glycosylphosphotransferase [Solirubrobacteraceae bacterium]
MSRMRVTQQTTSFPVAGRPGARVAPHPQAAPWGTFHGLLQRLLEEPGWNVLRPTVDFTMLCAAVLLALGGLQVTANEAPLLAMPPMVMALFFLRGLYRTRMRTLVLDGLLPVLSAVSVAAMAVAMIGLFSNGHVPSQADWVRSWLFALLFVGFGRIVLAQAQRWARAVGLIGKPVLIMGAGMVGSQVARRLESHPEYGLIPVGFVDDDPRTVAEVGGRDVPVLGTLEELDRIVERARVEHLIVAFSSVADARISRLIRHCQELGIEVSVVPRMFDTMNHRAGYETVGGLPLLSFSMVDPKGWQFAIKYGLDRAVAGLVLLLLLPLLALLALAVKLSTGGPVLFRQPRIGLDGREFDMLKFRTMSGSPDQQGESDAEWAEEMLGSDGLLAPVDGSVASAANGDEVSVASADRRTGVGRLLRRLSLDELPQFWNVCNGDMSLIGPRPERASYVRRFEPVVYRYGDRHRVKSGITGWAQVHGLRGKTSLSERVEWDNYYIAHWSLGLDLKIVLLTVIALFRNAE